MRLITPAFEAVLKGLQSAKTDLAYAAEAAEADRDLELADEIAVLALQVIVLRRKLEKGER